MDDEYLPSILRVNKKKMPPTDSSETELNTAKNLLCSRVLPCSHLRPLAMPHPFSSVFCHHLPLVVSQRAERHCAFTPSICTQRLSVCHLCRQTRWQMKRWLQLTQPKSLDYLEKDIHLKTVPWCWKALCWTKLESLSVSMWEKLDAAAQTVNAFQCRTAKHKLILKKKKSVGYYFF